MRRANKASRTSNFVTLSALDSCNRNLTLSWRDSQITSNLKVTLINELARSKIELCVLAPEILLEKPVTVSADLWSLGAVLFTL